MAVLLGNTVWEGTAPEMESPEVLALARDGHFYKQLDTGESYYRRDGEWVFINLGLSFIKATKSGTVTTDGDGMAHVTFVTPLIDTDYGVALTTVYDGTPTIAQKENLSVDGFDIRTFKSKNGQVAAGITVSWLATRHYNP